MRGVGGGICLAMVLGSVGVGCLKPLLPGEGTRTSMAKALTPMVPPEGLLVQSVLLEQPIGDAFLDRALWESTLPVGEPELRALLAENGLRVGILSGALPSASRICSTPNPKPFRPTRCRSTLVRKPCCRPPGRSIPAGLLCWRTSRASAGRSS